MKTCTSGTVRWTTSWSARWPTRPGLLRSWDTSNTKAQNPEEGSSRCRRSRTELLPRSRRNARVGVSTIPKIQLPVVTPNLSTDLRVANGPKWKTLSATRSGSTRTNSRWTSAGFPPTSPTASPRTWCRGSRVVTLDVAEDPSHPPVECQPVPRTSRPTPHTSRVRTRFYKLLPLKPFPVWIFR